MPCDISSGKIPGKKQEERHICIEESFSYKSGFPQHKLPCLRKEAEWNMQPHNDKESHYSSIIYPLESFFCRSNRFVFRIRRQRWSHALHLLLNVFHHLWIGMRGDDLSYSICNAVASLICCKRLTYMILNIIITKPIYPAYCSYTFNLSS